MNRFLKGGWKFMAVSAYFAAMFLTGCEQVVTPDNTDVAASYAKSSDQALSGDQRHGNPPHADLGRIFSQLNLTAEQRAAIELLKQQHRDCEQPILEMLRASERAIMESFKAQRKAIEDAVKAGTKTRDQARTEMRALEMAQKEALKNNPARATAEAALKVCRDTFHANIRALLTAEQQVTWDAWIANPNGGGPVKGDKGGEKPGDKGGIFKKLNLTADQMGAVDLLEKQRKACEDPIIAALKASEKTIMDAFKAERDAVKAAVQAGTMTQEAARTAIRDIENRQREALKNNPARATAEAALKACRDTFNAGVRALLTPEQQAIWDAFLANPGVGHDGGRREHGPKRGHR